MSEFPLPSLPKMPSILELLQQSTEKRVLFSNPAPQCARCHVALEVTVFSCYESGGEILIVPKRGLCPHCHGDTYIPEVENE
jgi:Zn finger protein HypA/HybF involved in hydrogenase expression